MIAKNSPGAAKLLSVENVHVEDCGEPPEFNASDHYLSYFENAHGEQWVFVGDREKEEAFIWGGDMGWDHRLTISRERICPDTILSEEERFWVATCWSAFSHTPMRDVLKKWDQAAEAMVRKVATELERKHKPKP
jgi:hypothetical protein